MFDYFHVVVSNIVVWDFFPPGDFYSDCGTKPCNLIMNRSSGRDKGPREVHVSPGGVRDRAHERVTYARDHARAPAIATITSRTAHVITALYCIYGDPRSHGICLAPIRVSGVFTGVVGWGDEGDDNISSPSIFFFFFKFHTGR